MTLDVHTLDLTTLTGADLDAMPREVMGPLSIRLIQAYSKSAQAAQELECQRAHELARAYKAAIGATTYLNLYRQAHARMLGLDLAPSHNEARERLGDGPHTMQMNMFP